MYVIAHFTDSGVPKTGLSPNIAIYRIGDNAQIVATTTMTEIANGSYKYDFTSISRSEDYDIWIDGGDSLGSSDRYKHQIIESDPYRVVKVIL